MLELIKNIDLQNKNSWEKNIFITFDIDWCSDEVLSFTLDILEKRKVRATFFVTHETPLLEKMRGNENIELGIHPNFNPLLNGEFRYGKNVNEVVGSFKKIVPEAVSVRSHSLAQSSPILNSFEKNELIFDCNTFIPQSSSIPLKPWKYWSQTLIKIPFFWEDDVHCMYNWDWNIANILRTNGLKVFNFHPIHVFLNTEHLSRYENSREHHFSHIDLIDHKNEKNYGIHNFLSDLITGSKQIQ